MHGLRHFLPVLAQLVVKCDLCRWGVMIILAHFASTLNSPPQKTVLRRISSCPRRATAIARQPDLFVVLSNSRSAVVDRWIGFCRRDLQLVRGSPLKFLFFSRADEKENKNSALPFVSAERRGARDYEKADLEGSGTKAQSKFRSELNERLSFYSE